MKILIILVCACISGVLGRMGGSGRYPRQCRVIGIPLLMAALAWILGVHSWWLLLMIGAMIGAISTYWDFLAPEEQNRDNFFLHGFFIGLATFPIAIATGHWWMLLFRCLFLAVACGWWSAIMKWDVGEEFGRYFIVPFAFLLI